MFKKKPVVWGALIAVLLLLNGWRWIPVWFQGQAPHRRESAGGWELDFPKPLEEKEKNPRRNLFVIGPSAGELSRVKTVRRTVVLVPTPTPAPSFPDGSVLEAAGGYHLMGVVSHGGKSSALIGKGNQSFQVGTGDEIDGIYQVQTITENEIYLAEKSTGNNLKLHLWDPQGVK